MCGNIWTSLVISWSTSSRQPFDLYANTCIYKLVSWVTKSFLQVQLCKHLWDVIDSSAFFSNILLRYRRTFAVYISSYNNTQEDGEFSKAIQTRDFVMALQSHPLLIRPITLGLRWGTHHVNVEKVQHHLTLLLLRFDC